MSFFYTVARVSTALSTTNDWITLVTAAAKALRIHEIGFVGGGTASAANDIIVTRPTAAGTGAGTSAVTAAPMNPAAPAAGFSNFSTYATTQPTLSTTVGGVLRFALNANGGVYRWVAKPGSEILIPAGNNLAGTLSIRSVAGTSVVTGYVIIEEI
jgi:hypothetical protein